MRAPVVFDERRLHDLIESALLEEGITYTREKRLGSRCRVDFLCGNGVALEVKRGKPGAARLLAQLQRYAACEEVRSLVVVVERAAHAPRTVLGKPCAVFGLNRLWGVAL